MFFAFYGKLILEKPRSFAHLKTALNSFTAALSFDPQPSLHRQISDLLLTYTNASPYDRFRQLADLAARKNPEAFEEFLRKIPSWHQKFSKEAQDIKVYYKIVLEVYGSLNDGQKLLLIPFLQTISQGMEQALPLDDALCLSATYRKELQKVREKFDNTSKDARKDQADRTKAFREFYATVIEDALFILGSPPCKYDIRGMGSLAREEICPFSDFEYFMLIEEEEYRPYFQELAELIELQILSLGGNESETPRDL
jgi:hypothetical protein